MTLVIKKSGEKELFSSEKIRIRLQDHINDLHNIDIDTITEKLKLEIHDDIATNELDNLLAECIAFMAYSHPDYLKLAGIVKVSSLHKHTKAKFTEVVNDLRTFIHPRTNLLSPLISEEVYNVVLANADI